MESEKNSDDLLKRHMKLADSEIPELEKEVMDGLRNKVAGKTQAKKEKISFISAVLFLLNFKLKFYQVALLLLVVISFFTFQAPGGKNPAKENETIANSESADSLESISVKDSRFLIRNFAVAVN
jgi:hypothetical protein